MKPDTPLDYAVFELAPTRTRWELMVCAGGETEMLSSGSVEPLLMHIKGLSDQIDDGGSSIKLETTADDSISWFTKGTIERFIRYVNAPELLEHACVVENELAHLEETPSARNHENGARLGTPVSATSPSTGGLSDSLLDNNAQAVLSGDHVNEDLNTNSLEFRRSMLHKEQLMAFANATASGFVPENLSSLRRFAECFGACRLQEACENYANLYTKKRETDIWPEEGLFDDQEGKHAEVFLQLNNEQVYGRRSSVQEKITMFESRKKDADIRRMSADITRTDTQKPVLRRWSLAMEQFRTSILRNPEEGEDHRMENLNEVVDEVGSEEPETTVSDSRDEEGAVFSNPHKDELPSLDTFLNPSEYEKQDDQKSVSDTQSLKDTKGRLYETYREKRDAKLREEESSKKAEKQARLKAMEETLEKRKAEVARNSRRSKHDPLAEARLRAEKLRAFKAGLVELKKAKEEEERKRLEELRMQRQQKKIAAAQALPASPRSGGSTPRPRYLPTFQRASSIGTNSRVPQAAVSSSQELKSRRNGHVPAGPSASELSRKGNKNSVQQEKVGAGIKPSRSREETSNNTKLRTMVLRRSVPSMAKGADKTRVVEQARFSSDHSGLKCLNSTADHEVRTEDGDQKPTAEGNMENGVMAIHAPSSHDEDDAPMDNSEVNTADRAVKIRARTSPDEDETGDDKTTPMDNIEMNKEDVMMAIRAASSLDDEDEIDEGETGDYTEKTPQIDTGLMMAIRAPVTAEDELPKLEQSLPAQRDEDVAYNAPVATVSMVQAYAA